MKYKGLDCSSLLAFLEGTGSGEGTVPVLMGCESCRAALDCVWDYQSDSLRLGQQYCSTNESP